MNRRTFIKTAVSGGAAFGLLGSSSAVAQATGTEPPFAVRNDITPYVVQFIAATQYADLPAEVIELGKKSLLDSFGLALVGAKSNGGRMLRAYFDSLGSHGNVRVLGTTMRLPLRFAAFANGVSIHMEDFDDTQLAVASDRVTGQLMHPSAPVFPVALGAADTMPLSGKDFMLGYHVGAEVCCKIAEACSPRAYKNGFHSTGGFGMFGSMAAYAKLRGCNSKIIGNAMAIAASQSGGLIQNFGTLTKPFHAGHAAEAGVVATELAILGWTGGENILEGPSGFFHAYGGSYDVDALLNKLGKPWTFASPGVSIKPYPSGALTHPGMTELVRLMGTEGFRAADVVQVEVGTNSQIPKSLHNHTPKTGLSAKFSMEYCIAAILVFGGQIGLGQFTDDVVNQPDLQEMMGRVRYYVDPEAEAAGYAKMTTILKIHLKDGRTIAGRADFGKGSPAIPMSYDEVADKFRACANYAGWSSEKAAQIIASVQHLEDVADMNELTSLCVG